MRKFLLTVGLIAAPTAVLAGVIPDALLGTWVTDMPLCSSDDAMNGFRDVYVEDGSGAWRISTSFEMGEGERCEVVQVNGDNPYLLLSNCSIEENRAEATETSLSLSPDGKTMRIDTTNYPNTYHRCPE